MSKRGGQSTQQGIYAQNWAAMSLFLQYVTQNDFKYIGFEGDKLEDFHLVFEDGRKIICESKYRNIHLAQIRTILDKIIKHGQVNESDEILIICKEVNKEAKSLVENFKYFSKRIENDLKSKKHKYQDKHLELLPQLRFWEVGNVRNTENGTKILMTRVLNYPDPFWVPKHRIEQLTNSLVVDKVFKGSRKGETLTKSDFLSALEKEKTQFFRDDGYDYEKVKQTEEDEVKKIIKSIRTRSKDLDINNELARLYANPSMHHFALMCLENESGLDLSDWKNLWTSTYQSAFSIELFKIFENNLKSEKNQQFALDFILENLGETTNYFREEFIKYDIVKLCKKILDINPTSERKIFEVLKRVYEHTSDRFLYVKRRRDDSWEREETAKLLEELYDKSGDKKLKSEIIEYLVASFNLVEDDGKFWHYTPPHIFRIIKRHISSDPERLILWITEKCIKQYNKVYKRFGKKLEFKGWEHMGGGISQSGSVFSISDKHFVSEFLVPALTSFYNSKGNKSKAWKFVISKCITRDIKKVNEKNPDFLNRTAIPVLLTEYKKGKHNREAFEILSDFIRMRKGIPWKNDLIFQAINNDQFTYEQKWKLIKVSLDEFDNLPVNVFVEQIISDLAKNAKDEKIQEEAIKTIEGWAQNPEYEKRHGIGSFDIVDNIFKLLGNRKTFNKGFEILQKHIENPNFIKKTDTFDTYDVAKAVTKVIEEEPKTGFALLEEINKSKNLTINQQITISGALYNIPDNKKKVLLKAYKEFLKPTLGKIGNIKKIEKRFSHRHARESFVQFAEKLAKAHYFNEALWLVKIFINDTDPILENYSDDPKGDFNYHKQLIEGDDNPTLGTVRGYCAWVLQKFCTRYGRDYIPEILDLVEQLTKDHNYYVRVQACIPLLELVKNRHTVLSENRKERFLPIGVAERIEKITFSMLKNKENHKLKAVMKHLAMVFTYMRSLDEKQAMTVLKVFKDTGFETVMHEAVPLFIFFAEFRNKSFKDWPWGDISKFDDKSFKKLLIDLLKNGTAETKSALAWQFNKLPDEIAKSERAKRQMTVDEAVTLASSYMAYLTSKYDHQVFKNIYRFVEEYIDSHFEDCFVLWTKCIETESKYFEDNWSEDKLHEMYWWPFFYNGKVLVAILDNKGEEEFLTWFEKLANYPNKVLIANDLDTAAEKLVEIKNHKKRIRDLFELLIKRNPKYYNFKQRWFLF